MGQQLSVNAPGQLTRTAWQLPEGLTFEEWVKSGTALERVENAVQWWLGDWWNYGEHEYGERTKAIAEYLPELNFWTVCDYGYVARSVITSDRSEVLSWKHHKIVAPLSPRQQRAWLKRAVEYEWSSNKLRFQIATATALANTRKVDLDAAVLGKFIVLYADPPWRYEHPPMGGTNRSIENQYPTMTIEEIGLLPVADLAHKDSVLYMWTTPPKLAESLQVLSVWGFDYRTNMVWIKDKIGMGYYARQRHEILLIARRGELPPPPPERRPDSVVESPRLGHSQKPGCFYDLIDSMYPEIRKIELFARGPVDRPNWSVWGNQAQAAE